MGIDINFTPALTLTDSGVEASGYTDVPWSGDQRNFIQQALTTPGNDWLYTAISKLITRGAVRHADDSFSPVKDGAMPFVDVAYWETPGGKFPRLAIEQTGIWDEKRQNWLPCAYYNPSPVPTDESVLRLQAKSAKIVSITQTPLIVASAHWDNRTNDVKSRHKISFSHSVSQSVEVSTSETHEVAKSTELSVEAKLPVGGDETVSEGISVTDSVEHSTSTGKDTTLESSGELEAELEPGQAVLAAMSCYKGTVIADVVVEAYLRGCVRIKMDKYKQSPHGFFNEFGANTGWRHDKLGNLEGCFTWDDIQQNSDGKLWKSVDAVTVTVKSDFYARLDSALYDVENFDEDTVNNAVFGLSDLEEQRVYP